MLQIRYEYSLTHARHSTARMRTSLVRADLTQLDHGQRKRFELWCSGHGEGAGEGGAAESETEVVGEHVRVTATRLD